MYSDSSENKKEDYNTWPPSKLNFADSVGNEAEVSSTFMDQKILRMMKMMGYQSGLGLGKNKQGLTVPVEVEPQYDKRGFGSLKTAIDWDFTLDNPSHIENVEWLSILEDSFLHIDDVMETWVKEDKPNLNVENEHHFCDKILLQNVMKSKNIFDQLDLKELNQARGRANPFETIRCVFFMNRASLKMANIDAATNFMFTNIDQDQFHKDSSGPYYFADVCAGPGGFTEYVLWRKKWLFKGFGFTLRGDNDFKINESVCACPTTFVPLYGYHNDGNICCPENIQDFKEKVLFETHQKGVHFVMSDGGFSVEGNENIQEILSKNIYICQCLTALEILRRHGHFVTKVFDIFTRFSVGLLYLVSKCFKKVCILKPNSSRPANSERYIICCNYTGSEDAQKIIIYLRNLVKRLWELKDNPNLDIIEIVPLSIIKNDVQFYTYILNSNNRIARYQSLNLKKIEIFCKNPRLVDHRQEELRKSCLDFWGIPDRPKVPLPKYTIDELLIETINNRELLLVQPREVKCASQLHEFVNNVHEWHYTFLHCKINTNTCNFYAGLGSSKVYRLQCNKWVKVKNLHLPRGTLLYGEFVKEKLQPEHASSEIVTLENKYSLHVIDALRLGDVNLKNLKFHERNNLIQIFCKAINQEFKLNTIRIRPKSLKELSHLFIKVCKLKHETFGKLIEPLPVLGYKVKEEFYEINSVLLLKTDENQSFHSSYVLRMQLFISNTHQDHGSIFYQDLIDFVKK